ncbi:uncharacterized protein K452DRAFT_283823 [Aplosporella prunicola CBS 121167]|uniref:Transcriptional regulatory protein RXT2 N-terminal domain-containing protein n=1 Tax=Aplosporella prunicola CBS 121167 TaxID=1176127 RepID=A0A6A6BMW3_9PEZI|nr:uncharacterized protein K452DRAFT_283823 [Aplosporella prunicola CBS 121167]KAF2145472.1 hypothetical protein K452DRAFT_283823 [Aplosporella prunicola CBS 121167]
MAGQQYVFAEAIVGMKKAVARYGDESEDDDTEITYSVQHKLKRKLPRGQSILNNGRSVYKKPKVEHAGYQRRIVARNPPRIDEDGDEIEGYDSDESLEGSVAEDNPYGEIHLEELLAPLTSAADLHTHPSMSIPYYSTHLTELAINARDSLQREEKNLWRAKGIMKKLLGDDNWFPVGMLETDWDRQVLETPVAPGAGNSAGSLDALSWEQTSNPVLAPDETHIETPRPASGQAENTAQQQDEDTRMEDSTTTEEVHATNGIKETVEAGASEEEPRQDGLLVQDDVGDQNKQENGAPRPAPEATDNQPVNGEIPNPDGQNQGAQDPEDPMQVDTENGTTDGAGQEPRSRRSSDADETSSQPTSRRMTTRAQANAAHSHTSSAPHSPHTFSPSSPSAQPIHPLFGFPLEVLADRDMGLPAHEAEETRNWLLLYIQKQEEVVKQHRKLYNGLMEADRKRKYVLKWCRAEGHVGEMSDGEDWVDKEEWGLTEDLVKGKEEEEEEGVVQGKKTRARRRDQEK